MRNGHADPLVPREDTQINSLGFVLYLGFAAGNGTGAGAGAVKEALAGDNALESAGGRFQSE